MLSLLFAILASAAIAFLLKLCDRLAANPDDVLLGNYISTVVMAGAALLLSPRESVIFVSAVDFLPLATTGVTMGILHYSAFKLYQLSIGKTGVAISGAFAKLGILIPTLISMALWREFPTPYQTIGIAITLMALFYYYLPQKNSAEPMLFSYVLIFLMLVNGSADFMTKIFQKYFDVSHMALFLLIGFSTALVISVYFAIKRGRFSLRDLFLGVILGIPIIACSSFLILSLQKLVAALVFPIFSAGTLVAITLGGILFFKEYPTHRQWMTIGAILLALILINL